MSRPQFSEIMTKLDDQLVEVSRERAIMDHVTQLAYEARFLAEQTGVEVKDVIDAIADQLHTAEAMMFS